MGGSLESLDSRFQFSLCTILTSASKCELSTAYSCHHDCLLSPPATVDSNPLVLEARINTFFK